MKYFFLLSLLLNLNACFIFYPLLQKSFEKENNSEIYSLAAIYILSDKEFPTPGNGGILEKLDPCNASFTLNWNSGLDDQTDSSDLQYRVYVSQSDNIRTVGEIETNGEALNNFTKGLTSFEITSLRIRGSISYYNVLIQDSVGKKSAYSSVSATIIPKFLYVLNQTDNSISSFTIDKSTGVLTNPTTLAGGNSASSLYIPPRGNFLYQASTGENKIRLYSLNPDTGVLGFVSEFTGGSGVMSLIADQEGRYLYSAESLSSKLFMYSIDSSTGNLSPLASVSVDTGSFPLHLSIDPGGSFLYSMNRDSDTVSQFVINYTNGELTSLVIPTQETGGSPLQAMIDPFGLYAFTVNSTGNSLSNFKIDPIRGEWKRYATLNTAVGNDPKSIVFHPSGNYFYVAESTDNQIRQMNFDRTNGILQSKTSPTLAQTGSPSYLILDAGGKFLYCINRTGNSVSLYSVGSDGALTFNTNYATGNSPIASVIYNTVE